MVDLRSTPERRRRAEAALHQLVTDLRPRVREALGALEGEAFLARLEHAWLDVYEPLHVLYGERTDTTTLLAELVEVALRAAGERPEPLRFLDRRREIDPSWFQRARMIGYVCYVDRFAGRLAEVRNRLDYLGELGVTYLHLMPLLAPREGDNDGGYAVRDYRAVDPRLGTMTDLEELAVALHGRGMSLCIDLVLNHTAAEHEWAQKARAGDPEYRDFYLVFPDRTLPDAYERTLPEIFPDQAPGSFTYVEEMGGWVWTTFYRFQWDLNYANPRVFTAMLDTVLHLANRGVDVLRLDAVPFMWKRMGTNCQNQPEAHLLLQAFRGLVRLAAPGVVFKAEAIVAPEDLVQYLGAHDRFRPECDLAYNNQLMVMLWSSLAARDGRLATQALTRMRAAPPTTGWVTYARCHDDIGWAVSDADARAIGWDGWNHQRFLNAFYSGEFPGSFALGARFQDNPATGDARISGSAASLCGVEDALARGDSAALDAALRRLVLLYSVVYSYGGIPLVYMGDELALRNDPHWADDPQQALDNRWMHRPPMDWVAAERRSRPGTLEAQAFGAFQALGAARRSLLALRAGGESVPVWTDNPHVLAYRRRHARSGSFLALVNFADDPQSVDAWVLNATGIAHPVLVHSSDGTLEMHGGRIVLPGLGFVWLDEG